MTTMHARQAGLTLLELLVAVTILSVAMVSMLGLHARNIRLVAETQELTVAGMLASRVLAETRARPELQTPGVTEGRFTDDDERLVFVGSDIYGGSLADGYLWRREIDFIDLGPLLRGLPVPPPPVRRIHVSIGTKQNPDIVILQSLLPLGVPLPELP